MILTFGKHKGTHIKDVPKDYLKWGADNLNPHQRQDFQAELDRRREEEKQEKEWLKANLHTPEALEKLIEKAISDFNKEIAESGCEWEYDNFDIYGEAKKVAKEQISKLQAEIDIEKLKSEYQELLGLDTANLDKMEGLYFSDQLSRKNFKTEQKYNLAMEYFQKLDKLTNILYS